MFPGIGRVGKLFRPARSAEDGEHFALGGKLDPPITSASRDIHGNPRRILYGESSEQPARLTPHNPIDVPDQATRSLKGLKPDRKADIAGHTILHHFFFKAQRSLGDLNKLEINNLDQFIAYYNAAETALEEEIILRKGFEFNMRLELDDEEMSEFLSTYEKIFFHLPQPLELNLEAQAQASLTDLSAVLERVADDYRESYGDTVLLAFKLLDRLRNNAITVASRPRQIKQLNQIPGRIDFVLPPTNALDLSSKLNVQALEKAFQNDARFKKIFLRLQKSTTEPRDLVQFKSEIQRVIEATLKTNQKTDATDKTISANLLAYVYQARKSQFSTIKIAEAEEKYLYPRLHELVQGDHLLEINQKRLRVEFRAVHTAHRLSCHILVRSMPFPLQHSKKLPGSTSRIRALWISAYAYRN
ncbi:hypothetical protein O181_049486 [Austropuccinia psidii MF-1]|uniref:Uncharacterized protein n=1 Tax=Austropuccinia psidii MF-1 TaxID=1389203 RepID=A0A9Q3HLE7_9BASI|nr:hypothetical protein [Austropuccinia psidii MF-1]